MTAYKIPNNQNWAKLLGMAIEKVKIGDEIIVPSSSMKQIAEYALSRKRPGDNIVVKLYSGEQYHAEAQV